MVAVSSVPQTVLHFFETLEATVQIGEAFMKQITLMAAKQKGMRKCAIEVLSLSYPGQLSYM